MKTTDTEKYELIDLSKNMIFDAEANYKDLSLEEARRLHRLTFCYDEEGLQLEGIIRLNTSAHLAQIGGRLWTRIHRWAFEPEIEDDDTFLRRVIPEEWHRKIRSVGPREQVDSYYPLPTRFTAHGYAPPGLHGITFFNEAGEAMTDMRVQEVDFERGVVIDRYDKEHTYATWKTWVPPDHLERIRRRFHPALRDRIFAIEASA